ncbi:HEAT repeat domain-containing protein [Chloroflexales bacterium ZM16-3]|nr:HEAT repeat domain-containing protein [Chloroflexales bacterium ZM16-3]
MNQMPEVISGLIGDLCTGDDFRRTQASFALGVLGEPAVGPLTDLLASPEQELRKRAAWVIGVIGAPALPVLLRMAEGDDTQLRIEAIRVLGVVGEARSLNMLLLGLTDTDPHVATRAARALGKIGDPRAYHPLVTAMRHPLPDVRYEACRAIVDLRVPDGIAALHEFAEEDAGITSWGASVSEGARRAMAELESALAAPAHDNDFIRASQILRRQMGEE